MFPRQLAPDQHKLQCCRRLFSHPLILLFFTATTFLFLWTCSYFSKWNDLNLDYVTRWMDRTADGVNVDKLPLSLADAREVALQIMDVHARLRRSMTSGKPPNAKDLHLLATVAQQLYPPIQMHGEWSSASKEPQRPAGPVLCPEVYHGPKSEVGWSVVNCTGASPLHELVSVVVNVQGLPIGTIKKTAVRLVRDFRASYPDLRILMVGSGLSTEELTREVGGAAASRVTLISASRDSLPLVQGKSWNEAFRQVKTPYVLVARDLLRFSGRAAPLDRLVRMLNEVPGVVAVGGAVRNATGHWKVGCFQATLRNYVLTYRKGYHVSRNESMYCDYVDGPFLAPAALLRKTPLDASLEASVVFQDLFLTLGKEWLSMACPDVMFYADATLAGGDAHILEPTTWLNLARKRELNRIVIDLQFSHVLHRFSCRELAISCAAKVKGTKYYTIPVCCQEEFARAVAFWSEFCSRYHLDTQFDSGSCLGAVKMADLLPWDLDGDSGYPELNYTFLKRVAAPIFQKHGFALESFEDPKCCDGRMPNGLKRSYLKLRTPDLYVEMWGDWGFPYDEFLYPNRSVAAAGISTKMEIHGVWVNAPPNPGYYARKRYGVECLRHAQSWLQTGKKTSWEPYSAGAFQSCRNSAHHACLDRMPVDGSLGFAVPEW